MSTNQLFIEVLSLPARDRAKLVHRLLTSLEEYVLSPEVEAAWKIEALERCRAFDAGEVSEREADQVLSDLRAKLG